MRRAVMMMLLAVVTTAAWAQTQSFPTASGGTGTEGDPYKIATTADLDALAADVNSGTAYSGTYFKLTADITYAHTTAWDDATSTENNYTPIGTKLGNFTSQHFPFSGTFDGDGHTVSGIRIYRGGSGWGNRSCGLFGYVENGTVKNVTVADTRITGEQSCGGIVGNVNASRGTCTVENCHALSDVAIHAVVDYAAKHGGIAGTSSGSTISGCTSAVTLTVADGLTGCDSFGGIVGQFASSTMRNCLAIGVSIPVRPEGCRSGAIYGGDSNSFLEYNSYANCNVGGATTNIGGPWGDIETYENPETHDIENPDGAIPFDTSAGYILTAGRGVTADGTRLYVSAPYYRYAEGATVTLGHGEAPAGYEFDTYTVTQADGTAVSMTGDATFTMPATYVTADVVWVKEKPKYTLEGCTLHCDGDWNTLCLPFNVSDLTGTPLDGFTIKELDTETAYDGHVTGLDGTTLYLNFKDATGIEAGKPYIVKKVAVDEESTPTYTATAGTAGTLTQQGYANLVDGNTSGNRWRTSSIPAYCEFHSDKPVYLTGYTLTTGNQSANFDPTAWTLQAKQNEDDAWTVIDSRNVSENASDALPSGRTAGKAYTIQQPGAYQYFRFDVAATTDGNILCLTELTLNAKHLATGADIVNPTFIDVTVSDEEPTPIFSADRKVSFNGSFRSATLGAHGSRFFYIDDDNNLCWPKEASYTLNAFRGYFRLHGIEVSDLSGITNNVGLKFEGEATGILNVNDNETLRYENDNYWYSLDGGKLSEKPTAKGVYIHNGVKVVIK